MENDLWLAPNVDDTYEENFSDDGYVSMDSMRFQYAGSVRYLPRRGNLIARHIRFFKNVSLFYVSGLKLTWGDFSTENPRS